MARQIRDISASDYYELWWNAPKAEAHNCWWNDQASLRNIEVLGNGKYRVFLSNGEVKIVEPDTLFWLETF
jgi:hypothetical protein